MRALVRVGSLLAYSAILTSACSGNLSSTPNSAHSPNQEPQRALGEVRISGEVEAAVGPLVISYLAPDGTPTRSSDDVPAGGPIDIARTMPAGSYQLLVNGAPCGAFTIVDGAEVGVALTISGGGCNASAGPAPSDGGVLGGVIGTAPPNTVVVLDAIGMQVATAETVSDESGAFSFTSVVPGRYRLLVPSSGESEDIEVLADAEAVVDLEH